MGPKSARQYLSAVSRYHEDSGYPSPNRSTLVSRVMKAYENKRNWSNSNELVRVGLSAAIECRILELGLLKGDLAMVRATATVIFAFFNVGL